MWTLEDDEEESLDNLPSVQVIKTAPAIIFAADDWKQDEGFKEYYSD